MKRLILFFTVILLTSFTAKAQQITVSPTSVQLWGKAPDIAKASMEYKGFEGMALLPLKKYYYGNKGKSNDLNIGLFYRPIEITKGKLTIEGGTGIFMYGFPTSEGSRVNFSLELTYKMTETVGVEYQHISNGFAIQNSFNVGLDNFSIVINI